MNIAHYTLAEYLEIINPESKRHPATAYSASVESLNRFKDKLPEEGGPVKSVLNTFRVNGLTFKMIEERTDLRTLSYGKRGPDDDLVRDERGMAVFLTDEEKVELFPEDKRYQYEHAIVRVDTDQVVATTQDEWGCLLILAAEEYSGFRLGTKLLDKHLDVYPDRPSGGTSPQGQECVYRVYQKKVSEALRSGEYRRLYQAGKMDMSKIREILNSADVVASMVAEKNEQLAKYGVSPQHHAKTFHETRAANAVDLDFKRPEDWVAHIDNNFVIVYNKKLYDFDRDSQYWDNFMEEGIIGYAYVGGTYNASSTPKLFREFALNDGVRGFMYETLLNEAVGERIQIERSELPLFEKIIGENLQVEAVPRSPRLDVWIEEPTMTGTAQMKFAEKILRREKDPYEETFTIIHETASAMAEEAHEKETAKNSRESELTL